MEWKEDWSPEPSFIFDELVDIKKETEYHLSCAVERQYSLSQPKVIHDSIKTNRTKSRDTVVSDIQDACEFHSMR